MTTTAIERACHAIASVDPLRPLGRVSEVSVGAIGIAGLPDNIRLGDRVTIRGQGAATAAEIVGLYGTVVRAVPHGSSDGISVGDIAILEPTKPFAPDDSWIGRVIDPYGEALDGRPILSGMAAQEVRAIAPPAYTRRGLGARIETGLAVLNTLLPIVRGQRVGLFAGSGVGKSTLLASLARGVDADVIVIGLVGERGLELREFVENTLGPEGMARSVIVTATSDRAPQVRRRCALAATAVAEYFRDQGRQVLLLIDSVTRFAEAHREISAASGEAAVLRGYPADTPSTIAALCERAGPGAGSAGDITAIYSVLVQGSDMEEPVADWLRGVLDGHIVLDRGIAERGRFPAIDLLRSVSRSLPAAASATENALISEARHLLGVYDRSEMMVQSGLYTAGSDPTLDGAIAVWPALDRFIGLVEPKDTAHSFAQLRNALSAGPRQGTERPKS